MRFLIATFITTTCWFGTALGEAGFVEPKEAKGVFAFAGLPRASGAVLKIYDTDNSRCSSVFLSNDGILLTAAHCISECLKNLGALKAPQDFGDGVAVVDGVDLKKAIGSSCGMSTARGFIGGEILAVGPGDITYNSMLITEAGWSKVAQLQSQGFGAKADYALLRVSARVENCVDIGTQTGAGGRLWTVGFPRSTRRDNSPNSEGREMYVSTGVISKSVEDIPLFINALKNRNYAFLPTYITSQFGTLGDAEILKRLNRRYLEPGTFLSTVDIVSGNSGGGVFNDKGELLAINSRTVNIARDFAGDPAEFRKYISGSTMHVSVSQILSNYSGPRPVCKPAR